MLDCDLKYNYWRDEEWETPVVNEQEAKCKQAFEGFAVDLHSKQLVLNHQRVQQNTTSTTTAQHQTTTMTPSNSSDTSAMRDTATTSPTVSSASTISTATSTTTGGSTIATKSFGCSGKRRMKMKATEANKKYRTNSTTLNKLAEASMNELALYTNTDDDSQQFPLQELRYEGYVIGDNTVSSGQEDDININEDGYSSVHLPGAIGTESLSSSIVTIQSRYLSSRVHKSHLHNSMQFATQCFKYSKAHDLRYPTLSAFALKILAVPSTSGASERLFSTAKRIINTNRSNLSIDAAESSVVLSLWKKEISGLVI